jgi:hypothetical protein
MDGLGRVLETISRKTDDIFVVSIEELEIVFRLPPVRAVQQYATLLQYAGNDSERYTIYERIFRETVQDEWLTKGTGGKDLPAGIPETISNLILLLSGCTENTTEYTEGLFHTYRQQTEMPLGYMQRFICSMFPGYTFEILEELNYQKLVYIFIQAEKRAFEQGIIEKEHSFNKAVEAKPKPYLVEDAIKADAKAYNKYDMPPEEDPRAIARQQQIKERTAARAREEERVFKERAARHKGR